MSNMMKINVNKVRAALELIKSFRNVPLDSIEWVDDMGKVYVHPKEEVAREAGQGWFPLDDWKFCGLNNTSYFEQFIEPYIQTQTLISPEILKDFWARANPTELGGHTVPWPTPFQQINFCLDPGMAAARHPALDMPVNISESPGVRVTFTRPDIRQEMQDKLGYLDNDPSIPLSNLQMPTCGAVLPGLNDDSQLPIDVDHLIALADLRECIGRQMAKCPACDTEQVQLMDNLTNPLSPSWRCRSCKQRFHTTPTIPFNLLIRAKYSDLLKGQPVAAYLAENDPAAIPVHICKQLCCMNDGGNSLLPPYSVRLLTEDERVAFSKAKSFNISTTELFDAMVDEEPKYEQ